MILGLQTPGSRACVAAGDFYMLKFPSGNHILQFHSDGTENSQVIGSNALYEIIVRDFDKLAFAEREDAIIR